MSVPLATYLLREQVLKPDQVDDLLQLQVVLGGALDTQILEAGAMNEEALIASLAEAVRMPGVGKADIDDIPQRMPEIFPRVFAETYNMIPYRLVGRNLGVLVTDIPDPTAIMKLEQRLKVRIVPAITTEARIYYAMQRLYGAELPPRMLGLLQKLDAPKATAGTAAAVPAPVPAPAPVANVTSEAPAGAGDAAPQLVFQRELPSSIPERVEPIDLNTAIVKLQLARDRDQIIDVILGFANQAFKFAGLFVVQHKSAVGYRGRGDPAACARLPRVTVPLILQSMFKTVYDTQGHYLGRVPEASLNKTILADIGREAPKIAFLAPIVIQERVVGLIFADNAKRGVSSRKVADLLVLITRLGGAFERLIQKRKTEVKVAVSAVSAVSDTAMQASALKELTAPPPLPEPHFSAEAPVLPETKHTDQLLSQRFLNVLKAAQADDEEEEDKSGEESIDVSTISADALLGKEEAPAPSFALPKGSELGPLRTETPPPTVQGKAFAEFDGESEQDQVGGWETVLVETIQQGKQGGTAQAKPPEPGEPVYEVGWEDVIVEAAAQADAQQKAEAEAAQKPQLDDLAVMIDALDSPDDEVARRATENLWHRRDELGERLVPALGARFPGRLGFDPFRDLSPLPPVTEINPVMRLLVALGPKALPIVLPHMDSQYPAHRLIAVLFFGQMVSGHAFARLLRRLFDQEQRIRETAADSLLRYCRLPGYEEGLKKIRERLAMPQLDAQVRATEILGRLRDAKSVPLLIPFTGHKRAELARSSLGALMRLTAHDFGHEPKKWTEWWVANSDQPREKWLIEALRKREPFLRVLADEELRAISGLSFQFDPSAERKRQEPAIRAWEAWWDHELKARAQAKGDKR